MAVPLLTNTAHWGKLASQIYTGMYLQQDQHQSRSYTTLVIGFWLHDSNGSDQKIQRNTKQKKQNK